MAEGNFGYGQQDPNDSASRFNMIAFLVKQVVSLIGTMKLVKVVAVHPGSGDPPAAGTVDVQPLVKQVDGNNNATSHGTVFGVPFLRLQGGTGGVIADPAVGDVGLLIVSDRDITNVKSTKAEATPGSYRKFDISDGVYVGGILNAAAGQYLIFTADGIKIADKNGNVLTMTSSGFALTGDLAVTGKITATKGITAGFGGADQVGLQTHVHPGNNQPPTPGT